MHTSGKHNIFQKLAFLLICAVFTSTNIHANEEQVEETYNSELAAELGADEYGMKSYVFVTLLTGPAVVEDQDRRKEIFAGHFSNMSRLAKEGLLVLAGPLMDAPPKRGIYVFNVTTIEEAEALVKTDPAVEAGVFDYELVKFYGSAALMKINDIHTTLQKTAIE